MSTGGEVGRRAMTDAAEASWWARTIAGWHVAFAVMLLIAVVVLALDAGPRWPLAAGALTLLVVAYAVNGARGAQLRGGYARPYLVVLVLGLGATLAGEPSLSFLLFLGFPQLWLLSDTWREGVGWTLALGVAAAAGLVLGTGPGASAPDIAASIGVSVAFSCVLGIWIAKVIDQSQERADLIAALEATRTELAAAHHDAGVNEERARLARDIHDTLAQGFTSIVLLAQSAAASADPVTRERVQRIEDAAREGLAESRTLVAAMTPVELQEAGLAEALRRLAARVERESGVRIDVEADAVEGLSRAEEVVLLRAAQEALSNVRRHAGARSARVRLRPDERGAVVLEVLDDGVGLPPGPVDHGHGYGLSGMRRRVEEAGGVLEVSGGPGRGTRVLVAVPATRSATGSGGPR